MDERRSSILIVDDERSNLDVLVHILKAEGDIRVAKSGRAALKTAREHNPDLILLDIVMPDMDGFEVLAELKAAEATRSIPVIFITGLSQIRDEEKGILMGAVDYIRKPFNNSIVKARVRNHLQIVRQIRTIERLGLIDALTNIPNRRSFDHHFNIELSRAARERTPLGLLIVDADKFKVYNDTYGHLQGDVLLKALAQTIAAGLKRSADLAARLGGEEFGVVLPNTDLKGAMAVGEQIRAEVEALTIPGPDNLTPTGATVSVGAASLVPDSSTRAEELIALADGALYQAKENGRNQVRGAGV